MNLSKSYVFFISIWLICAISSFAQKSSWYFGSRAGIKFDGSNSSALCDGQMFAGEGSAVATDESGNLMFYTNGKRIYNSNHAPVFYNGTYDFLGGDPSSTHSALILPVPGKGCSDFFIFTTDASERLDQSDYRGLEGTLVRMEKGLPTVIEGPVPIYSFEPVAGHIRRGTEKIAATSDGKGGFWLLHHLTGNRPEYQTGFLSLHVSLNTSTIGELLKTRQFMQIGNTHIGYQTASYNVQGQMKFSPDGSKLALVVPELSTSSLVTDNFMELFEFDKNTGIIIKVITTLERDQILKLLSLPSIPKNLYGLEFSPDSKLLYISEGYSPIQETKNGIKSFYANVYQLDLTSTNVAATTIVIAEVNSFNPYNPQYNKYPCGALQLAGDGKIYLARPERDYVSFFQFPNSYGSGSGFKEFGISLTDPTLPSCKNKFSHFGLPTTTINGNCKSENNIGCKCNLIYNASLRKDGNRCFVDLQLSTKGACVKKVRMNLLNINYDLKNCENYYGSEFENVDKFIMDQNILETEMIRSYNSSTNSIEWTALPNLGNLDHKMFIAELLIPHNKINCKIKEVCIRVELFDCSCKVCEELICIPFEKNSNEEYLFSGPFSSDKHENFSETDQTQYTMENKWLKIKNPDGELEINHDLKGRFFKVQLYDVSGKILFARNVKGERLSLKYNVTDGIYLIKIENELGEYRFSRIFVKNP